MKMIKILKIKKKDKIPVIPPELMVILGLLGGVLKVESVLIDRNQVVDIVLTGSLKRKTEMDKILDQIGSKSFDEVMKALFERFG
ncbi:MAG: hypothetical protein PWQ67_1553 [Clostridia bacterium]|jgi:hypothetical protein|nr:hypothetical protein [Clostridia bacterium]